MLTLYWIGLTVGGVFVALAILGGLDGLDFDHHLDIDLDVSDPGDRLAHETFNAFKFLFAVVRSLKFWTFGLCFFGLTGVVLSSLSTPLPAFTIALIAGGIGCLVGGIMAGALHLLRQRQVDSLVRSADLVGLTGIVELPFDASSRGKVRVNVKGSMVDFTAYTDEPKLFQLGDAVLVVGIDQSRLWVVSASEPASPPRSTQH